MRSAFSKLFFKSNYSPFCSGQRNGPPDGARQLGFLHPQPAPCPLPPPPEPAPLTWCDAACALRDGLLLGRPLRCARTKRTKPVALASAPQVGAPAQGWGSARSLAPLLAGKGASRPPPRPACWKAWGSHPRSARLLCLRRRLGSVPGHGGSQPRGAPVGLSQQRRDGMQPVRMPTFGVRAVQPLLQGTAPASPLALPGDPPTAEP